MSFKLEDILEQVSNDPSVQFSKNDFEAWFKENNDSEQYHYLQDKTTNLILDDVKKVINTISLIFDSSEDYINKLHGWRYVEDLRDFQRGKHVRCIHKTTGTITNPMIGLDLKFTQNGTNLVCRFINGGPRVINYKYDDYFIFQKISPEEYMVLLANQFMKDQL